MIDAVVIAVPVNNEAQALPACIRGIREAVCRARDEHPEVTVSVAFALDRCTDGSGKIIESTPYALVESRQAGVGAARAAGVTAALRTLDGFADHRILVACTDADSVELAGSPDRPCQRGRGRHRGNGASETRRTRRGSATRVGAHPPRRPGPRSRTRREPRRSCQLLSRGRRLRASGRTRGRRPRDASGVDWGPGAPDGSDLRADIRSPRGPNGRRIRGLPARRAPAARGAGSQYTCGMILYFTFAV